MKFRKDSFGSHTFIAGQKEDLASYIKYAIAHFSQLYSGQNRGELRQEVEKLIVQIEKMRADPKLLNVKGPMSFSGGVQIYLMKETLCITHQNLTHLYRELDEAILKSLQNKSQIPNNQVMIDFPYLVIDKKRALKKKSKLIHSLLPKTCLYLKSCRVNYHFLPLLNDEEKSFAIKDAHLLDSSILGL